jgi:predicted enzyme related to lactoylglutathione lyase
VIFLPRVIHFDISAEHPEELAKFYEQVFNWKFEKWDGPMDYWLITTGKNESGIDGGLARREKEVKTINTINVSSIDDYIEMIKLNKGVILTPKTPIPGVGWTASFQDPEGNIFSIMQDDPSAK